MSKEIGDKNMDPLIPAVVKAVPEGFWKILYADLGQPAVQVVGKSLGKAFDFCCIPFHAMGYWSDKFKMNLTHRLTEYGKKLEKVPEENQCEVDPQIGAPILDHLSYTTNDEIADLFTTLLTNASNLETLDKAHPSFAHLISRLSVDEARIIKYLKDKEFIPYCSFRAQGNGDIQKGFVTIEHRATLLSDQVDVIFADNIEAYLSNMTGLGILEDNEGKYLTEDSFYNEICDKYNLSALRAKYKSQGFLNVDFTKSFYSITPFGRLFIDACVKD